jgi:hypothetical protein
MFVLETNVISELRAGKPMDSLPRGGADGIRVLRRPDASGLVLAL